MKIFQNFAKVYHLKLKIKISEEFPLKNTKTKSKILKQQISKVGR